MNEFEFLLEDRIAKIQSINKQYDLEHNAHISFSGGKDSTCLHYLIDMALPGNRIPRVYANTGIEYKATIEFVKSLQKNDDRFIIFNQDKNIKQTLEEYGYPFKSKEHSQKVYRAQNRLRKGKDLPPFLQSYITENYNGRPCPKILRYQFKELMPFKISDYCCIKLKKALLEKYPSKIAITGMRAKEGGARTRLTCLSHKETKFNPLVIIDDWWIDEFIKRFNIKLNPLYYPPYNFERTGCKGCPFAKDIQRELDVMKDLLPNEYKQCEIIWKPVYNEYRRINYRLKGDKDAKR